MAKYHIISVSIKATGRKLIPLLFLLTLFTVSCEDYFNPKQELIIESDAFYKDWNEYRAASMGLYALQQQLVDQIVILGELRGDLLEVTRNADRDLIEINNFEISPGNKYISPINFYRLISSCNKFITKLETAHPDVLNKAAAVTVYDRLYGEVLCMRAWAYFNAVRIYGKIPYIANPSVSPEEIEDYINSSQRLIIPVSVNYSPDGYYNDTVYNDTIYLDKTYLDTRAIVDTFTSQLNNKIKAVGVIHNMDNADLSWDVTVWNEYAMQCLMGQMYLFIGNLGKAVFHFNPFLYNYDSETSQIRFGLDDRFENTKWRNILTSIDGYEHIFTLWFNKSYQQQHSLQKLFSLESPNRYMLKPTRIAVQNWEAIWDGMRLDRKENPALTKLDSTRKGTPGDFYRGYGVSYAYMRSGVMLTENEVKNMLRHKSLRNEREVSQIMADVDTVVQKYSYSKNSYDHDANFMVYRAAGVHLYFAEIYSRWIFSQQGTIRTDVNVSVNVLNNGMYNSDGRQLGIRGRVGFGEADDAVKIDNFIYKHDPITNEITGFLNLTDNLAGKQLYLEDKIIEERARELAYEGERFYDLMRVAKRRGDPSYLADKIAAKFSGAKAEEIRAKLMNEENWYIPLY